MSKTAVKKDAPKPKSLKDQKKEIEDKMFGEKNKTKKKELQAMLKKIEISMELERKEKLAIENAKKPAHINQTVALGVDPKAVMCVNFLNKNCDKGDNCQFAHELKKEEEKEVIQEPSNKIKMVCRFLIDAINNGEYTQNWKCPIPNCNNIHKLLELNDDPKVEVSLEEFFELQRQTLDESSLTPVTEESFKEWKAKKEKEEEIHAKRVAALANNTLGIDLFKSRPEMFEDDEEADENVDYAERNYVDSDEEAEEHVE